MFGVFFLTAILLAIIADFYWYVYVHCALLCTCAVVCAVGYVTVCVWGGGIVYTLHCLHVELHVCVCVHINVYSETQLERCNFYQALDSAFPSIQAT